MFASPWVSCHICNVSPPPRVSDSDMHHGTCVTHLPWCMAGSLTGGFHWSLWREKRSRHSQHMRNICNFAYLVRGPWSYPYVLTRPRSFDEGKFRDLYSYLCVLKSSVIWPSAFKNTKINPCNWKHFSLTLWMYEQRYMEMKVFPLIISV